LALATVVLRCQRRSISGPLTSAAVLLCALATVQSFGVRAQVVGWAGMAMVLWLLESEGALVWAVVPVTIVWANLHASVFLAPMIAGLFALAAILRDRRWSCGVRRSVALTLLCAVATLITPLGLDLPRYAIGLLTSPIRHSISEWGATSMSSVAFVLGAFPLVLTLGAFGVRASVRDRIIAAAFTVLLFTAARNVPVFAFAVSPIALAAIPRRPKSTVSVPRIEQIAAWTTIAATALVAVVIPIASWRAAPAQESLLPIRPARKLLAEASVPPRVFCEDFAWCSIFLTESRPARFFMDGRADPYPLRVWRDYRTVLAGNIGWDRVLDRYQVNAVLVRRDSALDSLLAECRGWYAIGSDRHTRVYLRRIITARNTKADRRSIDIR
jgi:hypothetical protein